MRKKIVPALLGLYSLVCAAIAMIGYGMALYCDMKFEVGLLMLILGIAFAFLPYVHLLSSPDCDKEQKSEEVNSEPKQRRFIITFEGGCEDAAKVVCHETTIVCERLTSRMVDIAREHSIDKVKEELGLEVPCMNVINVVELDNDE